MRVERLRVWLLGSAVLLVLVIVGFIGSARYIRHRLLAGVQSKLGANVKVDTSGITYSHTNGGHTDYVIHAAKDVEHTDGKVALHDVWIKLYGHGQDRADMIRGDDWEWDKKAGVVRAQGVVHIDLQSAADAAGAAAGAVKGGAGREGKVLHVTTSDLIYMDKLGVAATSAPIEFESGAMKGHAVGADYASDSGTLMLHSAVSMSGMSAGRAVVVDAAAAELDGGERVVQLTKMRYSSEGRTAEADEATLHLRADQTVERMEAAGNVTIAANGAQVGAARADVALNSASHPVQALLTGGVRYAAEGPLSQRHGEALEAAIVFDGGASPQPRHAVFRGAVHFVERARAAETAGGAKGTGGTKVAGGTGRELWSTRELTAARVEASLAAGAAGKAELRDVEATGAARLTEVNPNARGASAGGGKTVGVGNGAAAGAAAGTATTEMVADDLKAHLGAAGGAKRPPQLETIAGRGHTLVRQVSAEGVEQTSSGDTLDARFQPGSKDHAAGAPKMGDLTLASVVQQGHVVVTRRGGAKGKAAAGGGGAGVKSAGGTDDVERATADKAVYSGDASGEAGGDADSGAGLLTLTGGVQLTESGSEMWASQLVLNRATGDAQATGAVKVDYEQSPDGPRGAGSARGASAEPTHILAERADVSHADETATFHGRPVRLWQGGSQIQAPVIELQRAQKRMIARGESGAGQNGAGQKGAAQVHTILAGKAAGAGGVQRGAAQASAGPQACASNAVAVKGGRAAAQQTVRVASGGLEYSQILGEARFTGGFSAEMGDGTVRANEGTVYLKSAKSGAGTQAAAAPSLNGELDRVVASGQVALERPGLRASGERLLYTAGDQVFLLSGDAKNPAKATDERGMTTGAALRFHRACGGVGGDTVEALGSAPGVPAERVHTESQVDRSAKREKEVR